MSIYGSIFSKRYFKPYKIKLQKKDLKNKRVKEMPLMTLNYDIELKQNTFS